MRAIDCRGGPGKNHGDCESRAKSFADYRPETLPFENFAFLLFRHIGEHNFFYFVVKSSTRLLHERFPCLNCPSRPTNCSYIRVRALCFGRIEMGQLRGTDWSLPPPRLREVRIHERS